MSEEQLKAFIEKVAADASLQQKLKAAADTDEVIAVARAAGFIISADDIKNSPSLAQSSITELSDEDLEGVAGGALTGFAGNRCYGL